MKNRKYLLPIIFTVLFVIDLFLVLNSLTITFDTFIYNLIRILDTNFFNNYFKLITIFGNAQAVILLLALLNIKLSRKDAIICDILTIASISSNLIIKNLIRRSRPSVIRLIKQGGFSFPSGHSMISIMLYGYLFYLARNNIKNKKVSILMQCLLIILIISICISRIYLGVHYASDVLGGIFLGISELLIILNFKNIGGEDSV